MLAGDRDGLFVEADPSGRARVAIHDDERGEDFGLLVEYTDLGFLAAALLTAAVGAHKISAKRLSDSTNVAIEYPTIVPTTLALGPSHLPDHVSMTLRFGASTLGFAIPREALAALGQAIVALGAGGSPH